MNVFEVLKQDHQAVRDLFAQMERSSDRGRRRELFGELRSRLHAHAEAERKVFYQQIADARQTRNDVREGLDEHQTIEEMLDLIAGIDDPAGKQWSDAIHRLRDHVEHHVQEEENAMFTHARQVLPDWRINALGEQVEEARRREIGQA